MESIHEKHAYKLSIGNKLKIMWPANKTNYFFSFLTVRFHSLASVSLLPPSAVCLCQPHRWSGREIKEQSASQVKWKRNRRRKKISRERKKEEGNWGNRAGKNWGKKYYWNIKFRFLTTVVTNPLKFCFTFLVLTLRPKQSFYWSTSIFDFLKSDRIGRKSEDEKLSRFFSTVSVGIIIECIFLKSNRNSVCFRLQQSQK